MWEGCHSSSAAKICSLRHSSLPSALPKFDEQPQDMTVFEGERARFPCALASTPSPTIKWFRNSHPLELDSRMTRLPSGKSRSKLSSESRSQAYYHCYTIIDVPLVLHHFPHLMFSFQVIHTELHLFIIFYNHSNVFFSQLFFLFLCLSNKS